MNGAGDGGSGDAATGADARMPDAGGNGGDGGGEQDAGGDAGECQGGVLCGQPATCCPSGNECVAGECLPACESGVRCGADQQTCCAEGELCVADACASPGRECVDSYDCEQPGQFCEPTLGQCLPQPDPLTCEVQPEFEELNVQVEWSYEQDEIISIPVVANLDDEETPEVVVNFTNSGDWPTGNVAVLEGEDGSVLLDKIPHDPDNDQYGSHGRSTVAVGDVSGNGRPDIIYAARSGTASSNKSLIVAVDSEGNLLWTSHAPDGSDHGLEVRNGAATVANFDSDPKAEVVFGASLIDDDGTVVWDQNGNGATYGTNSGYTGGISAVADLNDDGQPEIVSGKHAWQVDWDEDDPSMTTVSNYWTYAGDDGYPAIADLDSNGTPEVVLVASSNVMALDGQTGELWCGRDPEGDTCDGQPSMRTQPLPIPPEGAGSNRGGPPTVADFDDDGRPEIGVAGGHSYSVYDVNRSGETIPDHLSATPDAGALFVRWSEETQDLSSNATGSSVFDFQGDGSAEVVYADECYMRVYSGTRTGDRPDVQVEIPSTSATIHEYPLVVDVDGDNNSEVLIVANDKSGCPHDTNRNGLFVYGDANDEWVPTRRVWTQHTYHVTNATSSGNVPETEQDNWTTSGLNNYRQNVQGEGVFNAPDLTVGLSVGLDQCHQGKHVLRARVANQGSLGVPAGIEVTFYEGTDATGTVLGTATTQQSLLPGGSTVVTLEVDAPQSAQDSADYFAVVDGGESGGTTVECDDSNNTDAATEAKCIILQ
jgi:hypothetical protein